MVTFNIQSSPMLPTLKTHINDPLSSSVNMPHIPVSSVILGSNSISGFYNGSVVFMTGATGFLGKALLEKLLRSCSGIETIYILIRPKRGHGLEQRYKDLIKNSVFDRIREKTPEYFNKIKPVSGDVTQPNLGLSDTDKQVITATVTIAFHSAANVRFNESLKDAVTLNTAGTKRVIKLCQEMRKLKSFVHVSTAYSNADRKSVSEMVYPPPYDPESIMKCVETLPVDTLNIISDKIQGKHPNTYTLTKAMAEYVVSENSSEFPTAIVRPSIVTAAWKEPFPGWVDNVSGISGIMMEISRGTIRSIVCEDSYTIDVIPVDIVANTLITAAWHNVMYRNNHVNVYNCTSGDVNGITWKDFGALTLKHSRNYPSKYTSWYPGFRFRTNRFIHWICHWFLHIVPSCLLDILLYCTNHKPIMLRICNKFAQAAKNGTFFAVNEWQFSNTFFKQLIENVQSADDGAYFQCDMASDTTDFQWDTYVQNYIMGIRNYVLKDDESTLETARAKLRKLYWAQQMMKFVSLYMFVKYTILKL